MFIQENMQIIEIASIFIGLWTGISGATLPGAFDEQRRQLPVWSFAFAVGALVGVLPIVAEGEHFFVALCLTIAAAIAGFAATSWHKQADRTAKPASTREIRERTAHVQKAA